MELLLMRHADPEPADGYPDDSMRPLNKNGRLVQQKLSKIYRNMGVIPDQVFCSPRLRARESAEYLCYGLSEVEVTELGALDGGHAIEHVLRQIEARCTGNECVLCVGHEPDMSLWSAQILGLKEGVISFKKSDLMGFEFEDWPQLGSAKLKCFYRAKDLIKTV